MVIFNKSSFLSSFLVYFLWACAPSESAREGAVDWEDIPLEQASGFTLKKSGSTYLAEVLTPYPNARKSFRYLILADEKVTIDTSGFDAVIYLPLEKVVLTSTTQIPHLDVLGVSDFLAGFPNLDLISSETTRQRIDKNEVTDLGNAPTPNIEKILELNPDWIMLSTQGNDLDQLELYRRAGIPAIINGDYLEQTPLGRAEWIKFTGVLVGRLTEATAVYDSISREFAAAAALTSNLPQKDLPTVLSGVLYQDIWYAPGSDSWAAALFETAGGSYIFSDLEGTGSLALSYEYVLDRAQDADYWIGAADFPSIGAVENADHRYKAFSALENRRVFTYTLNKGEKGGLLYFELGYLRPDLVLLDVIKILHPELLPDYELYFYTQIDEK